MKQVLIYIIISCLVACNSRQNLKNFLYDIGNNGQPTEDGFVRVTANEKYNAAKGFGWLRLPSNSFDSANLKLPQRFLHEGVRDDSLSFRIDVPNGDYFIRLYLGLPGTDTSIMKVSINGKILPDTIVTPWYRLSYRTLCKKITINNQRAEIAIVSPSKTAVGLYGLELRPVTKKKRIDFATELEQDTAEIAAFGLSLQEKIASDSNNVAAKNQWQNIHDYLLACSYYNGGGWSWAVKKTGLSLIYRMYAAADLLEPIIEDNSDPLYEKSLYLLAKIYYWLDQEDDDLYHTIRFKRYFSALKNEFPDNSLLRMYQGEKIFDPPAFDTTSGHAPAWAVYQRETVHRMMKVIKWWVNERQTADGEMGGKYGDDVELLRWWLPIILGADDSIATKGYIRLANGVWNSDALERGFARRVDDVEHSAELFRDTHPAMFLLNYGDPEYVERCLVSMQNFRDVWTGITPLGHLHFKSYYLSATEALSTPPYNIDVALNARALLPGLWAAWYNRNPSLIKLFSAWSNAWVADAQRTNNGKPAGILPSAVSFDRDRIGGNSAQWYDAHLTYDYYQWDHVGHVCELQNQLVGMYAITGNSNFLKPVNYYATLMQDGHPDKSKPAAPGSLEWARRLLISGGYDHEKSNNPMGKTFTLAKRATHGKRYDSLVLEYGSPYNRYQLTHDKKEITSGFEVILSNLRYNFPLFTTEVKFTDRVYMPGSDLLMGMYTGHFGAGYEYPSLVATWQHTGSDASILVRNGDQKSAAISLYNFSKEKTIRMNTWQLEPGIYTIKQGIDNNDDDKIDVLTSERTVELKERVNFIDLTIPSQKETVIDIQQVKSYGPISVDVPDLALSSRDIRIADTKVVAVKIHNIGNKTARNTTVIFTVDGKETGKSVIPSLEAPNDLKPRWTELKFNWTQTAGNHLLNVKIVSAGNEITKSNNEAEEKVKIR